MIAHLNGKVAIVTGASSGIGRAAAQCFAGYGAKVIVADVDVAGGEETVRLIGEKAGYAFFIRTDVSRATDVRAMVSAAVENYGGLDYAFNNAGIGTGRAPTADLSEENWDLTINVNLKGVWLCMKYEIPEMLKRGGGAIVNTSSVFGLKGSRDRAAYTASKHGVIGLTKAASLEYARAGIRVNAVCPGRILTPLVQRVIGTDPNAPFLRTSNDPMGRMGTPEEIAECALWLCASASFVTGQILIADGGITA